MSRIKWADIKKVDDLYVCTNCLTRYERRFQAVECADGHNKIISEDFDKAQKQIEDFEKGLKK